MKNGQFLTVGIISVGLLLCVAFQATAQPPGGRDDNPERRGGPPPRYELGQVFPPPLERDLELSPEQQQELDAISKDLKEKLNKLLTPEQKQRIENFRPRGPGGDGRPDGRRPPPPDSPTPPEAEQVAQNKLKELPKGVTRTPVVFSGGHETDPRDRGRPVVLIAAALGVTSDVFRDAFSRVKPAPGGTEPDPAQVRQNKAVLMEALGKHGITNDRLDEVSNFYRYPPGRNSTWNQKPAVANALIKDGAIIGYEIVSGGHGYSSTPTVSVPKFKGAAPDVELSYGKQFESNGSITAITISKSKEN